MDKLQTELDSSRENRAELKAQLSEMRSEKKSLDEKITKLDKDLTDANATVSDLKASNKDLKNANLEKDQKITTLEADLRKVRKALNAHELVEEDADKSESSKLPPPPPTPTSQLGSNSPSPGSNDLLFRPNDIRNNNPYSENKNAGPADPAPSGAPGPSRIPIVKAKTNKTCRFVRDGSSCPHENTPEGCRYSHLIKQPWNVQPNPAPPALKDARKSLLCKFFFTEKGCDRGDTCPFAHTAN